MEYEMEDEDRLFDESTNPSLTHPTAPSVFGPIWQRSDDVVPDPHTLQTGELTPEDGQQLS